MQENFQPKKRSFSLESNCVDVVIFSFDRPLQLYALMESFEKYATGIASIQLIYRTSQDAYEAAYKKVHERFPQLIMHKQSSNPHGDFRPLVIESVYGNRSKSSYVVFAVDDNIINSPVNFRECVSALEEKKAWGFFLRMGKNITRCYTRNIANPVPRGKVFNNTFFVWKFSEAGDGEWSYPNTVDMTIYRKKDVYSFLTKDPYIHPNSLEGDWAKVRPKLPLGICYLYSKMVNVPLNIVNISSNRNMHLYTPQELLLKFQQGLKIDISKLDQKRFNAPHIAYEPRFIPKSGARKSEYQKNKYQASNYKEN